MTEQVANAEPATTEVAGGQTAPETATVTGSLQLDGASTAQPTMSPEERLDKTLSDVFDRVTAQNGERDAAKTAAAKAAVAPKHEEDPDLKALTVSTDEPEKAVSEPAKSPAIAAPNSLSAEDKALWSKAPPEVQQAWAKREQEAHAKISEQGTELKTYQPLREVFDYLRHQGVQQGRETDVVRNWAAAQAFLDRDPKAGIKWLAESYGVDLAQYTGQGQPQATQAANDPMADLFQDPRVDREVKPLVQQLQSKLAQVESQLTARERAEVVQRQSNANEIVSKFSADKPYWADVYEDVCREAAVLQRANPRTPMEQLLQESYDRAIWANKGIRERMLSDQKAEEAAKAEAARKAAEAEKAAKADKAKKMAAINQRTGTSASTPLNNGRWDDDNAMGAIYDRAMAR